MNNEAVIGVVGVVVLFTFTFAWCWLEEHINKKNRRKYDKY